MNVCQKWNKEECAKNEMRKKFIRSPENDLMKNKSLSQKTKAKKKKKLKRS